ncbi:MAG: DUF4423 domain-containing protein [Pseudomonadota bacterium]|nr:DUF4423 domain-containing protein [Pseudomonadota bacterium]
MIETQDLRTDDLKHRLQSELIERCRKNPKYSLRAFAKALDMDHSLLSKVVRGQRPLGKKLSRKLQAQLGWTDSQGREFGANYHTIPSDHFSLIADWYHFAIFELTSVLGFRADPKWIAQKLNITVSEVRAAIERLVRMKYLSWQNLQSQGKTKEETLVKNRDNITTVGNDFTVAGFRVLQKQVLEKALWALENVPFECRDQSSLTIAINKAQLPEIKRMIKDFRRKICKFTSANSKKTDIYQLGISFYPISKNEGES